MTNPKRVWSNNKTVWDGKKSVWLQDGKLNTYDGNWEDAGSDLQTYGSQWEEVSEDAILDVYDSNTPEPIGTPEDGIEATYTFKDYDGTVLKTGKVKDGETPVAPADPTREHYTFQGWNPTVGPISKNTEFVAVYIPENYTSYTITVETEAMPEGTIINYGTNETGIEEAPESDFPMTFDFSEPISLSYQSDDAYCGALLDNGNYQFWGTYENNSVHIEMNGEPLSNGDEITIDSDTTLKFVWDPPAPERCPASIQDVWGNDATIEVGQTAAVITKFTTTAECENVDYSNIVAYVRASYNVPSDVATASIDFNENKVYVTGVKAGECTVVFTDGDRSWSNNVTVVEPSYTFTINVENLPEGASIDNGEGPLEDFPIILDIPSGGSFNGACNSHEGDGDLNVTIYDTPDGSSEGVGSDVNISCEGYMPLFECIGFNLEDGGDGSYVFKKDDNYLIIPNSNVSMTISFTPVGNPAE